MADTNDTDCPLQFHNFTLVDHKEHCINYNNVLCRTRNDGVRLKEIDGLQIELEDLLADVSKRMRFLENERQVLIDWMDRGSTAKKEKEILISTYNRSTPVKKKWKAAVAPKLKSKNACDSVSDAPPVTKFWQKVEEYCRDITQEDLEMLENLMLPSHGASELLEMPIRGRLFAEKWMEADLNHEAREGRRFTNNKDPDTCAKIKGKNGVSAHSKLGNLTSYLLQSLVSEKLATLDSPEKKSNESKLSKGITAKQAYILEARIREELIAQNFLDDKEAEATPLAIEDPLGTELAALQTEWKNIQELKQQKIGGILAKAKSEWRQTELKTTARLVDSEIIDNFKKVTSARQKKRLLSKKDKDAAWKALREREAIYRLLENMI